MATIGQTLAAARVAARYTVGDLSTRTRIREQILRSIEAEDFVPCGGDFYARGHIRGLCRVLGMDPEPLLAEYDREHAGTVRPLLIPPQPHRAAHTAAARSRGEAREAEASQTTPRRVGDHDDPTANSERWGHFERGQNLRKRVRGRRPGRTRRVPRPRRSAEGDKGRAPAPRPVLTSTPTQRAEAVRRHWPWAVVAIILVLGVLVGVRTWNEWEGRNPLRTAFESGSGAADPAVLQEEDAAAEPVDEKPVEEEPVETTIGFEASDRSWIKVTAVSGEDLFTGFLLEDERQEYVTDDTVSLWVGNAGAITVWIDGVELGPAGAVGEVKEVAVGADGLEE